MIVLVHRDEVLFLLLGLGVEDEETALAAGCAFNFDNAVDLGDLGRILGLAGFE